MKKLCFCLIALLWLFASYAQETILNFTGLDRDGGYFHFDKVEILNHSQHWQQILYYPDTTMAFGSVGIDNYETQLDNVKLFQNTPNPFQGVTDLMLQMEQQEELTLEVYDLNGRKIAEYANRLEGGTHTFRLYLSTPQVYLLSAATQNGSLSIKMVNSGNGGDNRIEYIGLMSKKEVVPAKNMNAAQSLPFQIGDSMSYVGYRTIGNELLTSAERHQRQWGSEEIGLTFDVAKPQVETGNVGNITRNSVEVSGNSVIDDGGLPVTSRGVCWSTNPNPTMANTHTSDGTGLGSFTSNVVGLDCGTTYYVRAYAKNGVGTAYGNEFSVTTLPPTAPEVHTLSATMSTTANTMVVNGNVASANCAALTARGVCYGTSHNPTIAGTHTTEGNAIGNFTSSINLTSLNTIYYVRAYATNSEGTAYGEEMSVTSHNIPTVTTTSVTSITHNSAASGGNVTADGGATVTARGVCWSTSQNPTISSSHTTNGSGTGSFTSSLAGLSPNTTYYVRAYATNSVGTAYGTQKSFTTAQVYPPTVTTNSVSNITENSATCGGNVTSQGSYSVTARGVCWSTSQNPTISSSHTSNGSGTGSFSSSITGLSPNTTYYVRAYATNEAGIGYGNQVSFTTAQVYPPTVTTNSVTNVTENSATCGGNVTAQGTYSVTARGVCWSTSQNPTISNSHTTNGSGTGSFSSSITGLSPNTTYYVRAYATNEAGIGYGNQVSFTTAQVYPPTVTTNSVTNVTENSATCGGNVTAQGTYSVTARGVCWSTSQNPTISNSHTSNGSGTGSFSSSITGLSPNTTYYVRAYATNSAGTAYGSQKSFTTASAPVDGQPCPGAATITDIVNNMYNTVQIGNQCWMAENLRTTHYSDGTSISLGSSQSTSTAYRYYPNNNSSNVSTYGYLYNWKAVMRNSSSSSSIPSGVQGVCPTGWHVPSDAEWTQLTDYVSSRSEYVCGSNNTYIAKALASTTGWYGSSNTCDVGNNPFANNATGFSAVPAGYYYGLYDYFGNVANFWSATQYNSLNAYDRCLDYNYAFVGRYGGHKDSGFSVRCLRD